MTTTKLLSATLVAALLGGCGGGGGGDVGSAFLTSYPAQISPQLQAALRDLDDDDRVAVIVRLEDQLDSARFVSRQSKSVISKAALRGGLVRALRATGLENRVNIMSFLSTYGGANLRDLWAINGVAAELPSASVDDLALLPGVEQIDLDTGFELPGSFNLPAGAAWGVGAVNAPAVWNRGSRGENVVIAIMDTGVDAGHPDLIGQYRGGSNSWFDPHGEYAQPYDSDGHGTQATGLAVGGASSGQAIGVAPSAQWIAAKLFDSRGETSVSDIHLAFQWLLDPDGDPDTDDAPQVVNNSWGLQEIVGQCNDEFRADIAALRAADISVVFAAGNSGPFDASDVSPANEAGSLSVGAVRPDSTVDPSSSRGPNSCDGSIFPRISAPGAAVTSTDLTFGGLLPNSYSEVTGTSFAAPHVSGAIALLRSAFPAAGNVDIDAALENTALDLTTSGPDHDTGQGMVDVLAAFNYLQGVLGPESGSLQFSATGYSESEDAGSATISVNRVGGSSGPVSVSYQTVQLEGSDGALAGSDYTDSSGLLNFADGQVSATFAVPLIDDGDYENEETLQLRLSGPGGGASLGSPVQATLTIIDDEPTLPGFRSATRVDTPPLAVDHAGGPRLLRAEYSSDDEQLEIVASSALGAEGGLWLRLGFADGSSRSWPLTWHDSDSQWRLRLALDSGTPSIAIVHGREGGVRADVARR